MANYNVKTPVLFESFDTIGDWTSSGTAGGSTEVASQYFTDGLGSLKISCDASASSNWYATKTISRSFLNSGNIIFDFYVEDVDKATDVVLYLSSTTDFSKFFSKSINGLVLGWNRIVIQRPMWSNTGSEDWGNTMIRMRVRVDSSSSGGAVVHIDNLKYGYYSRPKVVLICDDGFSSVYTEAFAYMEPRGLKGTAAIVSNYIDTTNYMTNSQLHDLYDNDWDVINHTTHHTRLDSFGTQAEMELEVSVCKDYLISNGFTRNNMHQLFVYPNGGYNATAILAVANQGMVAARTVIAQSNLMVPTPTLNYLTLITRNLGNTTTLASIKSDVDAAVAAGATLIIESHKFVPSPTTSIEFLDTDFRLLIDHIYKYVLGNQLDMITFSEWYRGLTNPRKLA